MADPGRPSRVVIAGGGYIGLYTALRLERKLSAREVDISLVSPESSMTYPPFLPEAASGNIEPRHVVVPMRPLLRRTRVVVGRLAALDPDAKEATIHPRGGDPAVYRYDHIVLGLGSVSRVLPVPGLEETAIGFKSVAEAIYLRNHVLDRLDVAESSADPSVRARALTFVFVGGGYSGVEALAELEDLARDAERHYPSLKRSDMRWVLVEAAAGILPEVGAGLGDYAVERLRKRGIEVHLSTQLVSAEHGDIRLSNGLEFPADTLVWTAGVKAHPLVARLGLPTDDGGRVIVDDTLRVPGHDGVWAAGDCAAVPDLVTGGFSPPTAQHALRQARRAGDNIAATVRHEALRPFKYKNRGGLVSLGRYKGVAQVMGVRLKGFPAWFLHRSYHVLMIPSLNRKVRVIADWTVGLFFRRDVVQLGSLRDPRGPMEEAFGPEE